MSRYVVREKDITEIVGYEKVQYRFPVIMEEFVFEDGQVIEIPSVLNTITKTKYRKKSVTSCKNISTTICQFMNFIKETVVLGEDEAFNRLKYEKINGLNFYHLASFLNYSSIVCENSFDTVKQQEKRLFEFYKGLTDLGVIDVKWQYKMVYDEVEKKNKKILIKPLENLLYQVSYPPKYGNKVDKEVDLKEDDVRTLFEICEEEGLEDIIFGLALCIYGGVRQGELVNLRFEDVRTFEDKNIMIVNIKKRPELFIGRNLSASGVKRPRKQVVLNMDGRLYDYYERHRNYRINKLSSKNTITPALMVDRNGNAMTGDTYVQRFDRLKTLFLKRKELDTYSEYVTLSESKWGTHICRGIFTNLCIMKGFARNIEELKNLRGDNSDISSKPYWNRANIEVMTQRTIDVITSCMKYKNELEREGAFIYGVTKV